jgi:hypothetical protein
MLVEGAESPVMARLHVPLCLAAALLGVRHAMVVVDSLGSAPGNEDRPRKGGKPVASFYEELPHESAEISSAQPLHSQG